MSDFLDTFIIIAAGLAGGYFFKNINEKNSMFSEDKITEIRKIFQKTALLIINPVAFPFIGLATFLTGGILGLAGGRLLNLPKRQKGAFFCCSAFTNIGNLGGLFVFIILVSMSAGIILNLTGIPCPDFFGKMNRFLIPVSSFILLFSIGLAMRISRFDPFSNAHRV